MDIKETKIRSIIERVTTINVPEYEHTLYVHEHLTEHYKVCNRFIQDWGGDDVTQAISFKVRERIYDELSDFYKTPYYI